MAKEDNGRENKAQRAESRKLRVKARLQFRMAGLYFNRMEEVSMDEDAITPQPKLIPIDDDEQQNVMATYPSFEKFDVLDDYSQHTLVKAMAQGPNYDQPETRLKEWEVFKKDLPVTEGIFVRAYKTRYDLLTAVIVGAKGTPYHDGLFFFDLVIPVFYPSSQPRVRYRSGGLQINPHIYKCGAVCLSLYERAIDGSLVIWKDMWVPGTTNILQLLVSIRDVLLCANPLLNRRGYRNASYAEQYSLLYNEIIIIRSLKSMIHTMNNPPKNFENLVVGHFRSRVRGILMACKSYMEGRFLEGKMEERCSMAFRSDVASCVKPLVEAFIKIGATEAQQVVVSFSEHGSPLLYEPTFHAIANDDCPQLDVNDGDTFVGKTQYEQVDDDMEQVETLEPISEESGQLKRKRATQEEGK